MSKKYFGTDGIRGKVNLEKINGEMFFKFGLAAGTYFKNFNKKKTNCNYSEGYSPIWLYFRTSFGFRFSLCRYACFYFGSITNKWFGNAYKKNEGKYGNYDYCIT